jgi:hypothetical protein
MPCRPTPSLSPVTVCVTEGQHETSVNRRVRSAVAPLRSVLLPARLRGPDRARREQLWRFRAKRAGQRSTEPSSRLLLLGEIQHRASG